MLNSCPICVFWKEERGMCEKMCSRGYSPKFLRGRGSSKVTNAKGLECEVVTVCCWGVIISWGSVLQAGKISRQNMKSAGAWRA
jgi:hypothetical protein